MRTAVPPPHADKPPYLPIAKMILLTDLLTTDLDNSGYGWGRQPPGTLANRPARQPRPDLDSRNLATNLMVAPDPALARDSDVRLASRALGLVQVLGDFPDVPSRVSEARDPHTPWPVNRAVEQHYSPIGELGAGRVNVIDPDGKQEA